MLRYGVFLPPFGELADPRTQAALAVEAENAGWDGYFVWDHVVRVDDSLAVSDPFVVLSAIACATTRVLIGPLITPLARRRPWVVARQTVTLDRLSGGRLVLGVGLGNDNGRELSAFGEELDLTLGHHCGTIYFYLPSGSPIYDGKLRVEARVREH